MPLCSVQELWLLTEMFRQQTRVFLQTQHGNQLRDHPMTLNSLMPPNHHSGTLCALWMMPSGRARTRRPSEMVCRRARRRTCIKHLLPSSAASSAQFPNCCLWCNPQRLSNHSVLNPLLLQQVEQQHTRWRRRPAMPCQAARIWHVGRIRSSCSAHWQGLILFVQIATWWMCK